MFALERNQIQRLLGGVNLQSPFGRRDYLLILFLFHTGLRIGEACRLTVDLVAYNGTPRDELHLPAHLTKTRKARVVPLNNVAQACVAKLLTFNAERDFSQAEGVTSPSAPIAPLFVWRNHRKLPPREAQRILQNLREKVGLSAKATPHTLRHSFASELVRAGVTLPTVKSLLGHQWLSSTQIYTHTSNQERITAVALLAKATRTNP